MGSNNDNVDKGIGADPETKDDERTWIVIACFLAVALYNTVELTFIIFTTFIFFGFVSIFFRWLFWRDKWSRL